MLVVLTSACSLLLPIVGISAKDFAPRGRRSTKSTYSAPAFRSLKND